MKDDESRVVDGVRENSYRERNNVRKNDYQDGTWLPMRAESDTGAATSVNRAVEALGFQFLSRSYSQVDNERRGSQS